MLREARNLKVVQKARVTSLIGSKPNQHGLLLLFLHRGRLILLVCAQRLCQDAFNFLFNEWAHFDLSKHVALIHRQHRIVKGNVSQTSLALRGNTDELLQSLND